MSKTKQRVSSVLLTLCLTAAMLAGFLVAAPVEIKAAGESVDFNTVWNPNANPANVVVNQPFVLQVSTTDSTTQDVGNVPVTFSGDGLAGVLQGVTGPFPGQGGSGFFFPTVWFATPGAKTVTATADFSGAISGGDANVTNAHTITVTAYGNLYSIGCASPVTSLGLGANGTFAVVLRDEWGNAITTAGTTITATVNGTGGSSITNSATTDANGAATFTLTAGSVGEQVTVTFTSGAISTPYTVNIANATPAPAPAAEDPGETFGRGVAAQLAALGANGSLTVDATNQTFVPYYVLQHLNNNPGQTLNIKTNQGTLVLNKARLAAAGIDVDKSHTFEVLIAAGLLSGGSPQTGDSSSMVLWILCGGGALLGLVLMVRRRRATQS